MLCLHWLGWEQVDSAPLAVRPLFFLFWIDPIRIPHGLFFAARFDNEFSALRFCRPSLGVAAVDTDEPIASSIHDPQ